MLKSKKIIRFLALLAIVAFAADFVHPTSGVFLWIGGGLLVLAMGLAVYRFFVSFASDISGPPGA